MSGIGAVCHISVGHLCVAQVLHLRAESSFFPFDARNDLLPTMAAMTDYPVMYKSEHQK